MEADTWWKSGASAPRKATDESLAYAALKGRFFTGFPSTIND
jgi:hypothetical protein